MRIHHLNCISMCPPGRRLMDGNRDADGPAELACHCLLIEGRDGLVLVDTGFGLHDVQHPRPRLSPMFLHALCRPRLREEDTALRQIERLGFAAEDVRHIVLTHLDFDHAGGLDDFPDAMVHLMAAEKDSAARQDTALDRRRFRPRQWSSMGRWITYATHGDRWFGFDCVSELSGITDEIFLVPLPGHTWGHAGIAVRDGSGWLLHFGDAYFYRHEMNPLSPHCPPGLRAYQRLMEKDRELRLKNQDRLRQLVRQHSAHVRVFCAHDLTEFEQLRGQRLRWNLERGERREEPSAST
jgi:glyoxylase-like metal-dependent hydrolase (beta-lactamase superfamily II)